MIERHHATGRLATWIRDYEGRQLVTWRQVPPSAYPSRVVEVSAPLTHPQLADGGIAVPDGDYGVASRWQLTDDGTGFTLLWRSLIRYKQPFPDQLARTPVGNLTLEDA